VKSELRILGKVMLLAILLLGVSLPQVSKVTGATVEIGIKDHTSSVVVKSSLFQNMTKLPQTNIDISGAALLEAQSAIQDALKSRRPTLNASSLAIRVESSKDWINTTTSFSVDGFTRPEKDTTWMNLSWIRFKVTSDLKAENLSYNLIGQRYLLPFVASLSNKTGMKYYSPVFTPITPEIAVATAGNASTFDFSEVPSNISSWAKSFDANSRMTSWATPARKAVDLRIVVEMANVSKTLYCYTINIVKITVQGYGSSFGDTIIVEASTGIQEVGMLGTIVGLAALGFVAHYYGRKAVKGSKK
jgi:hypothetical protein